MVAMIGKVLPVIILITLGSWFRRKNIISEVGMAQIKKLILTIGLPSVLFKTFIDMELKAEYLILLGCSFVLLFALMGFGALLGKIPILKSPYNPYISTGYAFGLVGLSLFIIIFGEENLLYFSIIGLAHEVFTWTFYYIMFRLTFQGQRFSLSNLLQILKTPLLISIAVAVLLNISGFHTANINRPIWDGLIDTINLISQISTPLILLSIGHGIHIEPKHVKEAWKLILVRLLSNISIGFAIKLLLIDQLIPRQQWLDISYTAFLLLPPLFTLPLIVSDVADEDTVAIVNNAVAIYTFISIAIFILYAYIIQHSTY